MGRSTPRRKLICKVKSVPRAILSSIVALQRGVGPGDSCAISLRAKQSPLCPRGCGTFLCVSDIENPCLNVAFHWSYWKKKRVQEETSRWLVKERDVQQELWKKSRIPLQLVVMSC